MCKFFPFIVLLLFGEGEANIFRRVESPCNSNNVKCLSRETFTFCVNREEVSVLMNFEFNCPRNYVCDEDARYPCLKDTLGTAITTKSELINTILDGLVVDNSLGTGNGDETISNEVVDAYARVPPLDISALDDVVVIVPETTTPSGSSIIIVQTTPVSEDDDTGVIITPETTTTPSSSIIITPDATESVPNSNESVIITPTTSSSSIIITPDTTGEESGVTDPSVIITPNATEPSPNGTIIISSRVAASEFVQDASVMITPITTRAPSPSDLIDSSVIITADVTNPNPPPVGTIVTSSNVASLKILQKASVIITPTAPPSPSDPSVIIVPSTAAPTDPSVVITPDVTNPNPPPVGTIVTSSNAAPIKILQEASVILTPTAIATSSPSDPSVIVVSPTPAATDSSVIISPNATNPNPPPSGTIITTPADNSEIIVPTTQPPSASGSSVIITPNTTDSSDTTNSSVIITPGTNPSPNGTIILSPNSALFKLLQKASVIIAPSNAPPPAPVPSSIIILPTNPSPPSTPPSIIILPTTTPPPSIIIVPTIPPPPPNPPGSIIITPTTTTPKPSSSGPSIIITPNHPRPPGPNPSIIIAPNGINQNPPVVDVVETPSSSSTLLQTQSQLLAQFPNWANPLASIFAIIAQSPVYDPATSQFLYNRGTSLGNIDAPSPTRSVVPGPVVPETEETEDVVPQFRDSIIITPDTTASPGSVIITPTSPTVPPGSVIITPTPGATIGNPPDCTNNGVFWGPNCGQYYECVTVWWWYEYRLRTCNTGQSFSLAAKGCVPSAQSECVN